MDFELEFSDFNKAVNIEAPSDAKEFDLGGFGLGGAPAPVEPAPYGDYDFEDGELPPEVLEQLEAMEGLEGLEDYNFEY